MAGRPHMTIRPSMTMGTGCQAATGRTVSIVQVPSTVQISDRESRFPLAAAIGPDPITGPLTATRTLATGLFSVIRRDTESGGDQGCISVSGRRQDATATVEAGARRG